MDALDSSRCSQVQRIAWNILPGEYILSDTSEGRIILAELVIGIRDSTT